MMEKKNITIRATLHILYLLTVCTCSSCSWYQVTPPSAINLKYGEVLNQRHNFYHFKDGDIVRVALYNREGDLNQTELVVLPDGRTDLFLMDNYRLGGKTVAQFEYDLKTALSGEIRETDFRVQVTPRGEVVHLVGEFLRPSTVPLTTKMTLQEAISTVGGTLVTGDTDWALLRRPHLDPGNPDLLRIDLNDESAGIFLLPGDQIVLGRTFLAAVVNYLREYVFGIFPTELFAAGAGAGV